MIAETGQFTLLLALALALLQTGFGLWGGHTRHPALMAAARSTALAQGASLAIAFAALTALYVMSDFSVVNVATNSHSLKPMLYKVTGVWGNHEGSMLLWVTVLALFGAGIAIFATNVTATLQARVLGIQGLIGLAFLAFVAFTSNPFLRLDPAPLDGEDLNPLLQDPGLAFHPPLLYLGYVGLSVTYAFAIAALLEGKVDAAWARWVRPWTLFSWATLTLGIALGSWWAYYELGWGGWWFWDPVENASLMPWLIATALLHSAIVVERREALKSWTILLAILAFSFSLLGFFIVRSGVITSVHAFASDPTRGVVILGILVVMTGGGLALFAWRAAALRSNAMFGLVSREVALLVNNVVLAAVTAAVLIGTLYPLLGKELLNLTYSVGPPYFDTVTTALMGPLMLLLPLGPLLAWKRADAAAAASRLWLAACAALVAVVVTIAFFVREPVLALFGVALGVWLIAGALTDIAEKARIGRAPWRTALARLVGLPRAQVGTAFAHAGIGLFLLGAIGTTVWQTERVLKMQPGDRADLVGYTLAFDGVAEVQGPNYIAEQATFRVLLGERELATLLPEKRNYPVANMPTTEAAIWTKGIADIYAVIGDQHADGAWTVRLYYNPLAPLIWFGAGFMALGAFVSLSDRRYRVGAPGLKRRDTGPAPAPAE